MQNFRIVLIGSYPPPFGGVSTNVMQLAEQLVRENSYSVRVFAPNRFDESAPEYISRYSIRSIDISRNLFFKLREFRPDIIHSQQSTLDWRIGFVSKVLGIPIIHHIHGERFPDQYIQMSPINRLLLGFTAKTSTAIITVSSDLANFIKTLKVDSRHIYIIPSLLPLEENLIVRDKFALSSKQLMIVTTGFYPFANPHYGFQLVPYVARKLRENNIRFTWYLVGQAGKPELDVFHQSLVENGVQGCVEFIGELGRPQMLSLLRDSHIYVRTKYSDSFGIVIAEAHQLGCHCLYGDNNPYFQEGPRLTTYRTGDVDFLTEKLLAVISQTSLDKPRYVESPFANEAQENYETIKRIYEEVVVRL